MMTVKTVVAPKMSRQRSIRIGDDLDRFIEERIGSDAYRNADDVVEAGLRLLRDQTADMEGMAAWFARQDDGPSTVEELRKAIREGEESGLVRDFDFKELHEEIDRLEKAGRNRSK